MPKAWVRSRRCAVKCSKRSSKAIDQRELDKIEKKWRKFVDGDNLTGETFVDIWDADKCLRRKGGGPLFERINTTRIARAENYAPHTVSPAQKTITYELQTNLGYVQSSTQTSENNGSCEAV